MNNDDYFYPGIRKFDRFDFKRLNIKEEKQQHNIMMLVGNGFDISILNHFNMSIKTDYNSFFHYLNLINFDTENILYKQMDILRQHHESELRDGKDGFPDWSDFESRLQEHIPKTQLSESNELSEYNQLREHLAEIQQQFSKFLTSAIDSRLLYNLDQSAQKFHWAYSSFARFLADLDENDYELMSFPRNVNHHHLFYFNIINFNYTPLLDSYLHLDQKQFDPHVHKTVDTNFLFRRNPRNFPKQHRADNYPNAETGCSAYLSTEIHHPHGTQSIPRSLLFGIDGTDEIASDGSSRRLEKNFWAQTHRRYYKMIKETELFIIFGSSTGETDRWWWRHILKSVFDGAELIIYKYFHSKYDAKSADPRKIKENFFVSNYDDGLFEGQDKIDSKKKCLDRIHIVRYSDPKTISAFGFSDIPYDPTNRDPRSIPNVR